MLRYPCIPSALNRIRLVSAYALCCQHCCLLLQFEESGTPLDVHRFYCCIVCTDANVEMVYLILKKLSAKRTALSSRGLMQERVSDQDKTALTCPMDQLGSPPPFHQAGISSDLDIHRDFDNLSQTRWISPVHYERSSLSLLLGFVSLQFGLGEEEVPIGIKAGVPLPMEQCRW
ncbi:UNVERIFIED_CONTAM: hypothetical protein K2H54_031575 [Gekko kuhli]